VSHSHAGNWSLLVDNMSMLTASITLGAALEYCAANSPVAQPIVCSLWAQKVRRWNNLIILGTTGSAFRRNNETVAQLVRSCFTSFLRTLSGLTSNLT